MRGSATNTNTFLLIIHSSFRGGDGGGEVGVGMAAAVIIFPCLYLAIFFQHCTKG